MESFLFGLLGTVVAVAALAILSTTTTVVMLLLLCGQTHGFAVEEDKVRFYVTTFLRKKPWFIRSRHLNFYLRFRASGQSIWRHPVGRDGYISMFPNGFTWDALRKAHDNDVLAVTLPQGLVDATGSDTIRLHAVLGFSAYTFEFKVTWLFFTIKRLEFTASVFQVFGEPNQFNVVIS